MGATCYKSKKPSVNKVQDSPPESKDLKDRETNPTHNNEEDHTEKKIAKLSTAMPMPPENNHIVDQLATQKSLKEEGPNIVPLRSKQASIKVSVLQGAFF